MSILALDEIRKKKEAEERSKLIEQSKKEKVTNKKIVKNAHLKLIYRNRISYTNLGIGAGIKEVYIFKIE